MNDKRKKQVPKVTRTHKLSERMLLVKASLGRCPNTITDKSLTADILEQSGCAAGAAVGKKELFAKADISPVTTPYNQARSIVDEMTLPWGAGWKCIPVGKYQEFIGKMNVKFAEIDKAANVFSKDIDAIVERQRQRLAGLFKEDDYPSARQFLEFWHHNIETQAMPSTDVRIALDDDMVRDIQRQTEKALADRFSHAWQEVAERLASGIAHVSKILNSDGAGGRKSPVNATLIENLKVQVEVTREMAVAVDDHDLINLTNEVERKLLQIPSETLAANPSVKEQVGKDAEYLATRAAREVQAVDKRVQDMVNEFGDY
jgi:hypothetical protein